MSSSKPRDIESVPSLVPSAAVQTEASKAGPRGGSESELARMRCVRLSCVE